MADATHSNWMHIMRKVATQFQLNARLFHHSRGVGGGGVRVSLLFCLATKQNLEWPTFISTPIPPPFASLHTRTPQRIHWDWMRIQSARWIPQSQHAWPHPYSSFLSKCRGRLSVRPFLTRRPVQWKEEKKKWKEKWEKKSYPMRLCV